MTDIDLDSNMVGNEGAKWIARLLENNNSVTYINLSNNKIGNEGARLILEAVRKNKIVTEMPLYGNKSLYSKEIDCILLNSIDTVLERNIQAKEAPSKKSDQEIDSVQEKLPVTDTKLEENQNISKGMQQLKEVGQEQKSEQQKGINAVLAQIINNLKLIVQKLEEMHQQLDVVIGEVKLLTEQSSMQVLQTQLTENSSGTEEYPELLGVVNLDQTEQIL